MTQNAAGNIRASASLAASATSTTSTFDVSAKFGVQAQIGVTFGTVAATSGLQVDIYRSIGSTPVVDTLPITSLVIPAVASTTSSRSIELGTGKYQFKVTNLDATNSVTLVYITGDTIDAVA
jgi:hypothetical protein